METPDFWDGVFDAISSGMALMEYCQVEDIPYTTVQGRMRRSPELTARLSRAREARALVHVERMEDIANRVESGELDPKRASVSLQARQWLALVLTMLGVSVSLEGKSTVGGPGSDPGQVVTWLSTDVSGSLVFPDGPLPDGTGVQSGGSWNKTWHVKTDGWSDDDGFFGQTTSYVAASGKMLHAVRADTVRSR